MRILIAPDKFKGSLSALQAAEALKRGMLRALPEAQIHLLPMADGGEGTAAVICSALKGSWIKLNAQDSLGQLIPVRYAWVKSDVAVIEMAEASGLWRIPPEKRDLLRSSTFGTGQMITDAIQRGAKKIFVGMGGSATNDAGIGMAAAIGYRFVADSGKCIEPIPLNLPSLAHVLRPKENAFKESFPDIIGLSDVNNPLLGAQGASHAYGPQKGADSAMATLLDNHLSHLADVVAHDLECDYRNHPGAGAAGGLGYGLLSFCAATLQSGFDWISKVTHLEELIADSDLIVTGEGRIDARTFDGKGPAGVAALAKKLNKPVIAFAGSMEEKLKFDSFFDAVYSISDSSSAPEDSMRNAAQLLEEYAERAMSARVQDQEP